MSFVEQLSQLLAEKSHQDVIILGNQSGCARDVGWEIHDLIVDG